METFPEKRRVAKASIFVLLYIMFQRYSTAAILTLLLLFVNLKLGYDQDVSTTIYHFYAFLSSCFAIVGAIIADSWLGIYKTLFLSSITFAAGSFIIAITAVDALKLPMQGLSFVALMIVAVGDGSLKALGRAYGASQYRPSEFKSITLFFVLYYFVYHFATMMSRLISPMFRQNVKCFGSDDCFSVAFGIPALCMIVAAILTSFANRYSESLQSGGCTLLHVLSCIWHSIVKKIRSKTTNRSMPIKQHWLDYSEEKYGKVLVWETRVILQVLALYLLITFFWSLSFQQGSRWVFQAARMNGNLGFCTIIPEQFNLINSFLVLLLIPVFEKVLYPLLAKVKISGDLQKVTLGGLLAGVAFLISAIVEFLIASGKYLHMTWLIPQYVLMAMGEILITIPLTNFSYTVAPTSMKTMFQAFHSISMGLGNLIVAIVVQSKLIDSQIYEFILFAGLMFVDMIAFAFLAKRFHPLKDMGVELL